jgi:hypothetical protein
MVSFALNRTIPDIYLKIFYWSVSFLELNSSIEIKDTQEAYNGKDDGANDAGIFLQHDGGRWQ